MKYLFTLFIIVQFVFPINATAQNYSIVIKGGHVIDPKNNINETMDIAIYEDSIVAVAKNIDENQAKQVVNAKGMYVTPGLIDIHSHNFPGIRPGDPMPDGFTFRNGVTTVVDAGSSGWRTFPDFKKQVIDISLTRVLAFLNIVGEGFKGNPYEQNTRDMDAKLAAITARQYEDYIIGFKVAHYTGSDWIPVDSAVKAGNLAGHLPVMIDFGGSDPPLSIKELFFEHLRPGDIFTHCFAQLDSRESIVDVATQKVKPFVWEAQNKGIFFDVGYGGISFTYSQAIPAIESGFFPNSISTDGNHSALNSSMKNLLSVMSKFIALEMDLTHVIKATTWNPAQQIKRKDLGHISVGAMADIAVFTMLEGSFGFYDYTGYKMEGKNKLECEMTIRAGKIVYDLNGIADPIVLK